MFIVFCIKGAASCSHTIFFLVAKDFFLETIIAVTIKTNTSAKATMNIVYHPTHNAGSITAIKLQTKNDSKSINTLTTAAIQIKGTALWLYCVNLVYLPGQQIVYSS